MNEQLQQKLFDKHPEVFKERALSPQETCMCWGLEIGDGWYDLIDMLCEALTYTYTTSAVIDEEDGKRLGIEPSNIWKGGEDKARYFFKVNAPQVVATQVKEKFGTLRFYYRLEYDPVNTSLVNSGKYPDLEKVNARYADYIDGTVHFAEIASARTCEVTGAPGELHVRRGWLKCLSREVAKTEKYAEYIPYADVKKEIYDEKA